MKLSIIIPVFNEEKTIGKVIDAVEKLVIPMVKKEVIVINDASTDSTGKELQKYSKKYKDITLLEHTKNQGKGAAVITGIHAARGKYIIIQDADLEYNPEEIKKLVSALPTQHEGVVFGTRLNRLPHLHKEENKPQFLLHFFGNRFLSLLVSMIYGQWITDMETCYKLFPRSAVSHIMLHARGFELEPELTAKLLKMGFHIIEVPITTKPRGYSEGKKLHTFRDGVKALWSILKYRFSN